MLKQKQADAGTKAATSPARLDNNSTAKERKAANDNHHQALVAHTLDAAVYGGHGHYVGKQGAKGHDMPKNDAHRQSGQFIPRAVHQQAMHQAVRQNTFSENGSADADGGSIDSDYGNADNKKQ
jgi:hypothetical protein